MKKIRITLALTFLITTYAKAQKVSFEEYDLNNGMHVILHQDTSAPVVTTAVMYHVGAKDEQPNRTGMAHFFEHLLFEGTKNIKKGDWFKIVAANGGKNNANTTDDRTYYYEIFPSNNLALGLWMESERLLHPVINQSGVDTQNEVVKEEKRLRVDNQPYGKFLENVKKHIFKKHPYKGTTIGKMEHLDNATLEEFLAFNKKFYVPNNATLVVAGDIDIKNTKKLIQDYFATIPRGAEITRNFSKETPITQQINAKAYDANIQIPAIVNAYRTPAMKTRDARVLDMISTYLSDGKSSVLYKKLVDTKKMALQVGAFNFSQEDYGTYIVYGLPLGKTSLTDITKEIDEEIVKIQTNLISVKAYQKLQNKFENNFVNANASVEGIANSLARYHVLYGDTNLINTEIDIYRSITRKEIKEVAKKYLNPNQRLVLEYLPTKK
ncbi:M16 family metallopeptidase [Tenacibaculum piscium]|uniref:Peptidase M16 n=1 Tax=Tenacibaculum piscium TaxID=1458515 RepID=A0A2H1YK45_9FLAO|nr:pitrilysin family protein [Tenacibaculum piscium]MBE7629350.1 insulinase family protein [Tenacibaculum piscium]MBE7670137.1 insulinase family protein [Tenacibaculum piscium]MBE7685438.1 insulinase family protein [Tenacibaculum piscium]MBE7690023.1 insulinase family protein [Tenacibaculum piscium]SOS75858.1 Peptidase M16 [Tenacibaculum piscium]